MGIASLVIGVFAAILAAIATAPWLGIVALGAAPLGVVGLALGIGELARSGLRRARGSEVDSESVGAAWRGVIVNALAFVWAAGIFATFKGFM